MGFFSKLFCRSKKSKQTPEPSLQKSEQMPEPYRKELVDIYIGIKGLPIDEKMMQSVVRATNPLDNSINEKVARIREAFVTRFDERLATNYIVNGSRGEAKCISLHREFVEWQ